jgi:hypothetical protein
MSCKKNLRPLEKTHVKIFKIANRRGYACLCLCNLTEGTSPIMAYQRMQKAVRRLGRCLPDQDAGQTKKLVRASI